MSKVHGGWYTMDGWHVRKSFRGWLVVDGRNARPVKRVPTLVAAEAWITAAGPIVAAGVA